MAEKAFSLAVVKGPGQGAVLRTERKRISVGSAGDNDLVVDDPQIEQRHFMVLIDQGRWRIHTFDAEHTVTVDRRWAHPTTGERGAILHVGSSAILLYPGLLEERVIERELGRHKGVGKVVPEAVEDESKLVTKIVAAPTTVDPIPIIPEVIAEPESQVMPAPRISRSSVNAWGDSPERKEVPRSNPRQAKNSWGDTDDRSGAPASPPKNAWGEAPGARAASSAFSSSVSQPSAPAFDPVRPRAGTNAWGDSADRSEDRTLPPEPEPRPRVQPPERRIARSTRIEHTLRLEDLVSRAEPELMIIREPDGRFATAIRLLVARIEERMQSLGYRAYMITSPEPLTGKTTSACNLAFALAEDTHRRVALIEANFRHPRLAKILGVPEDVGLIPLLEGRAQLPDVTIKVSDRNLILLPAGGRYENPAELLSSSRFKGLVEELAHTVDIAVIDAPSVTPFADANLVVPLVDAAIFVVAEGRTRATWVAKAAEQIGAARVLGVLYNRIGRAGVERINRERKGRG